MYFIFYIFYFFFFKFFKILHNLSLCCFFFQKKFFFFRKKYKNTALNNFRILNICKYKLIYMNNDTSYIDHILIYLFNANYLKRYKAMKS